MLPGSSPRGGSAANNGATMRGAPLTLRIRLGRTLLVPLIQQPIILAPLVVGGEDAPHAS